MNSKELALEIRSKQRQILNLQQDINDIAQTYIPDFHFLLHKVSTSWECEESPIGMCVFELDDELQTMECIYCKNPEERK